MADQSINKFQKLPEAGDAHQLIEKINELTDAVNLIYKEREFTHPMIVTYPPEGEKKDGTS